jgi:ABC-2 type transport system permease protein
VTEALAFVRAGWLGATSFRINALLSLFSFGLTIVPLYFIAGALEPMMADAVAGEASRYFAFLIVGLMVQGFLIVCMSSLPTAISRSVESGSLEAMLATPIALPTLLFGLVSYDFLWTLARTLVFFAVAMVFGMRVAPDGIAPALLVFVMLLAAHVPIGLFAVAAVLTFRNATPLPKLVITGTALLGGIYYPAHVVPSWLQYVSGLLPGTYGLRAVRETLLGGASLGAVGSDLLMLCLFVAVLMPLGLFALKASLRYARTAGSLAYL